MSEAQLERLLELTEASDDLNAVLEVLRQIEQGEHATTGRQFGQGMAHAAKLVREAMQS